MPIDIPTAIASVNSGIQLAKGLVDASSEMDKAQLKLKIVGLVDQLVDAKDALVDARAEIRKLEEEKARLIETFARIDELVESQDFKYRKGDQGQPVGQPYCPRCLESECRLISLQHHPTSPDWNRVCPECKNEYLVDKQARDKEQARAEAVMRSQDDYDPFD